MKVGVVVFPGMNCEDESVRALASVGLAAEIVPANAGEERLGAYDGYLLPGGFSYEDRIRAGIVAALQPAMDVVRRAADEGKPVAGICNGAQILLETGLVPGLHEERVDMALALNESGTRVGYYCDWRWVTGDLFDEPVPLPFAHAEGRFVTKSPEVREAVLERGLIAARYCDREGHADPAWPINPNGAWEGAAAMRNGTGNVIAIMPHPERANWAWQVPLEVGGSWADAKRRDGPGPGRPFFEAFARMLGRVPA